MHSVITGLWSSRSNSSVGTSVLHQLIESKANNFSQVSFSSLQQALFLEGSERKEQRKNRSQQVKQLFLSNFAAYLPTGTINTESNFREEHLGSVRALDFSAAMVLFFFSYSYIYINIVLFFSLISKFRQRQTIKVIFQALKLHSLQSSFLSSLCIFPDVVATDFQCIYVVINFMHF